MQHVETQSEPTNEAVFTTELINKYNTLFPGNADFDTSAGRQIEIILTTNLERIRQLREQSPTGRLHESEEISIVDQTIQSCSTYLPQLDSTQQNRFLYAFQTAERTTVENLLAHTHMRILANLASRISIVYKTSTLELFTRGLECMGNFISKFEDRGIPFSNALSSYLNDMLVYYAKNVLNKYDMQNGSLEHLIDLGEIGQAEISNRDLPEDTTNSNATSEILQRAIQDTNLSERESSLIRKWIQAGGRSIGEIGKEMGIATRTAYNTWSSALQKLKENPLLFSLYRESLPKPENTLVSLLRLNLLGTVASTSLQIELSRLSAVSSAETLSALVQSTDWRNIARAMEGRFSPKQLETIDVRRLQIELQMADQISQLAGVSQFESIHALSPREKLALVVNNFFERTVDAQLTYQLFGIDRSTLLSCIDVADQYFQEAELLEEMTDFVSRHRKIGSHFQTDVGYYLWILKTVNNPNTDILTLDEIVRLVPERFYYISENLKEHVKKTIARLANEMHELDELKADRKVCQTRARMEKLRIGIENYQREHPGVKISTDKLHEFLGRGSIYDVSDRTLDTYRGILQQDFDFHRLRLQEFTGQVRDAALAFIQSERDRTGNIPSLKETISALQHAFPTEQRDVLQRKLYRLAYQQAVLPVKHRGFVSEQTISDIRRLGNSGIKPETIAEQTNTPLHVVKRLLRSNKQAA